MKCDEPTAKTTSYNIKINKINFFDQPVNQNKKHDNSEKITTGQWDDYTTGCLLNYA